jgi:MYXO-CTERM domain-containing protein
VTELVDDHIDQDCDGGDLCYADADSDHHRSDDTVTSNDLDCGDPGEAVATVPDDDCDDHDALTYPGAPETVGDEVDEDCDGSEVCYVDGDADGYHTNATQASNDTVCTHDGLAPASSPGADCDDADPSVYPGADDTFGDDVDQNCDGGDGSAAEGGGTKTTTTCGCATESGGSPGAAGLVALLGAAVLARRQRRR